MLQEVSTSFSSSACSVANGALWWKEGRWGFYIQSLPSKWRVFIPLLKGRKVLKRDNTSFLSFISRHPSRLHWPLVFSVSSWARSIDWTRSVVSLLHSTSLSVSLFSGSCTLTTCVGRGKKHVIVICLIPNSGMKKPENLAHSRCRGSWLTILTWNLINLHTRTVLNGSSSKTRIKVGV